MATKIEILEEIKRRGLHNTDEFKQLITQEISKRGLDKSIEQENVDGFGLTRSPIKGGLNVLSIQKQLLGLEPMDLSSDPIVVGEDTPWLAVLGEGVGNIPSSSKTFATDILNTIIHPIQTLESISDLAVGGIQKLTPGEQPLEENVDMLVDFVKDRYGSEENLKQTIAKDPVGVLADAASFLIPGGAAIKGVGTSSKINMLAKAGNVALKTGARIDPFNIAKASVRFPAKFIPRKLPSNIYKRAVKFSSTIPTEEINKLVNTALDNEILPTANGLDKLKSKINVLNKEITDIIKLSDKRGQKVNISNFFRYIDELRNETIFQTEFKAVNRVVNDFGKRLRTKEFKLKMSPMEAQRIKQRLYKQLETAYSKITQQPIKKETAMVIASGIRQTLEDLIPGIRKLNQNEGSLINLRKAIDGRVASITKGDIIPFSIVGKTLVGGQSMGNLGAAGGLGLGILSGPTIKSKLAIVLNNMRKKGIAINPTKSAIRLGLITPERIKPEETEMVR
jgi:hypothetical protein